MSANQTYVVAVSGTTGTSGTIVPWSLKQSGRSLTLKEVSFSPGGTVVAAALATSLNFYTSVATGGPGTVTPGKFSNQSIPNPTTSCRTLDTAPGTLLAAGPAWQVQPLGGLVDVQYPLDVEPGTDQVNSNYIGLQVVCNGTNYPFSGYVIFEEK